MSSVASNRCPFRTFLSLRNRKKSHGARCGEYGCCCNRAVPCLAKNCCTRCEVCAGALSWWRIQSPSRHFSGRFRRTDSRKRRKTSRTFNLLLLRTVVLTLAIISSFLYVDDRPERRSLSTEFLPSLTLILLTWRIWWASNYASKWQMGFNSAFEMLNQRNQSNTCVRTITSSPNACCSNWYVSVAGFPILKQNLIQIRCSVLSTS